MLLSFLNATVGLDTSAVAALGFQLESSPRLTGVELVVNDLPSTFGQRLAVGSMAVVLLVVLGQVIGRIVRTSSELEYYRLNDYNNNLTLVMTWSLGLFASCLHNADNILRPGTYFTPSWIVTPKFAFAMDQGFLFWLSILISGVWSLHLSLSLSDCSRYYWVPVLWHTVGTSVGRCTTTYNIYPDFRWWHTYQYCLKSSWEFLLGSC